MADKTVKYHISTNGQVVPCTADVRTCPRSQHFENLEAAQEHFMKLVNEILDIEKTRKLVPEEIPTVEHERPALKYEKFPYSKSMFIPSWAISIDYDYYGPPEGEEEEEYNRNYIYKGARVFSVDLPQTLASTIGVKVDELPADLLMKAEAAGYGEKEAWGVYVSGGYYGEELSIEVPVGLKTLVSNWIYSHPNAEDQDGALAWVRRNGLETAGKTPLEAVKSLVLTDHSRKSSVKNLVSKADRISHARVLQSKLVVNAARLKTATAYNAPKTQRGDYDGVVVENSEGKYVLVDGYRTLKALQVTNPRTKPHYLVLTSPESKSRRNERNRRW